MYITRSSFNCFHDFSAFAVGKFAFYSVSDEVIQRVVLLLAKVNPFVLYSLINRRVILAGFFLVGMFFFIYRFLKWVPNFLAPFLRNGKSLSRSFIYKVDVTNYILQCKKYKANLMAIAGLMTTSFYTFVYFLFLYICMYLLFLLFIYLYIS